MVFVRLFESVLCEVPLVIESSDERSGIVYDMIAPCRIVTEFRNDLPVPTAVTNTDFFRSYRLADEIRIAIRIIQWCQKCRSFGFGCPATQAIAAPYGLAFVRFRKTASGVKKALRHSSCNGGGSRNRRDPSRVFSGSSGRIFEMERKNVSFVLFVPGRTELQDRHRSFMPSIVSRIRRTSQK